MKKPANLVDADRQVKEAETALATAKQHRDQIAKEAGIPSPGTKPRYFVASYVARVCGVDLKTIHNWCDRGKIPYFRTPGQHLRFRAAELAAFLRQQGYDVPEELEREAGARAETEVAAGAAS